MLNIIRQLICTHPETAQRIVGCTDDGRLVGRCERCGKQAMGDEGFDVPPAPRDPAAAKREAWQKSQRGDAE